ncbi:DUF3047 domain-containing protein [Alcanivorax sp. IL2]|uniref:DUF3047 domain-containing protein n=2 Tax=Alcanivorax TaxID=59753 RepID=UPI0039C167E0
MSILGNAAMKTRPVCDPLVQCIPMLLFLSLALLPVRAVSAAPDGWQEVVFEGRTDYRLEAGCWQSRARGSASGLARESAVDVTRTPYLHWQWRADQIADWPEVDERIKAGDDFQARVYVVKKGWLPWQTRAINYVWSRQAAPGTNWPNPFASQAVMVVVQGPGGAGRWQSVTRNVREDFRRFHGMDVDSVDAVAIMTDGDNTGTTVASCYRLPEFRASP